MIIDFDERNVENVCRKKMIGYYYFGYGRPAFCIPLVIPRLFLEPDKTIVVLFVGGPIGSERGQEAARESNLTSHPWQNDGEIKAF